MNGGRRRGRPRRTHRRQRPRVWRCADCGSLVREGQLATAGCLARHSTDGKKQGRAAGYGRLLAAETLCSASGDEVDRHHKLTKDELRDLPQVELKRLYVELDD